MKKPLVIFLPPPVTSLSALASIRFASAFKFVLKVKSKRQIHVQKMKYHISASPFKSRYLPHQGLTLIEALVAIIVFSIGLLGMIKLLSVSGRLQNNMEYQVQANLIASNIREILTAPDRRNNPAFIEGVLDGAQCNAGNFMCDQGRNVRQSLNQQNQNLYSSGQLNVRISHATVTGNGLMFTNNCHDPIFVQVSFQTNAAQTSSQANNSAQVSSSLVRYNHQVGQYRIFNNNRAAVGVTCS
jgi:Tfp pilus assembly protein PilV